MVKKKSVSSVRGKRVVKSVKYTPDKNLDFDDISELTDSEIKKGRRVGRPKSKDPAKQLIAIRIHPKLLSKLRKLAKKEEQPYQTLIHDLLEKAVKDAA